MVSLKKGVMKSSWSLSCFGVLGTRGNTVKGNLNASVAIEKSSVKKKRGLKRLFSKKGEEQKEKRTKKIKKVKVKNVAIKKNPP